MFIVEDPTVTVKCKSTKQTTTSHLKHLNTKKEHDIMVLEFQFLANSNITIHQEQLKMD
jgi:hypothetical protein